MSTDHRDLRERIAATLASHNLPDGTDRDGQWAADALMPLITAELAGRWEQGRKHGLRQAWAPQRGREKQLEAEIESMLTIEEGNRAAWLAKCERVRELEAETARLQALADRRWVAYQSARERAQAYGEGILRHVEERNWVLGWLKAAERRAAELDTALDTARSQLAATELTRHDQAHGHYETTTAPAHTEHDE